jgi:hypothetical protein
VEPEETSIARQRLGIHVPAATNTQATIGELLETVFCAGSARKVYNEKPRPAEKMLDSFECCVQLSSAMITENRWRSSSAEGIIAKEGPERGKLKIFHC